MANTRFHRATGSAAIASTLAPDGAWQLESIRIHLDAAGGAAGDVNFTATLDHQAGAPYDVVLLTVDMTTVADYIWHTERPMEFDKGTELDFVYANAGGATYGLEVIFKGI